MLRIWAMKATGFDPELYGYLSAHRTADDKLLEELREETRERFGRLAMMQVAPEQGTLLSLLVAALGATRVVELGTFTGYSTLCMARGLPPGGRILACDVSEEYTAVARHYWERAGVADRIELVLAPALETLQAEPADREIDFAFIDADKTGYTAYLEELLPRLRTGGLLAIDNVLWDGRVIDPSFDDEDTRAIRAFNDAVCADTRVQSVMLAVSDGLTLIRKL